MLSCGGSCADMFDRRLHLICNVNGCYARLCGPCMANGRCIWPHSPESMAEVMGACALCNRVLTKGGPVLSCGICDAASMCAQCRFCWRCQDLTIPEQQGGNDRGFCIKGAGSDTVTVHELSSDGSTPCTSGSSISPTTRREYVKVSGDGGYGALADSLTDQGKRELVGSL